MISKKSPVFKAFSGICFAGKMQVIHRCPAGMAAFVHNILWFVWKAGHKRGAQLVIFRHFGVKLCQMVSRLFFAAGRSRVSAKHETSSGDA